MTHAHHPSDALLTASAAGTLGLGEHIAVATHVHSCAHCRRWVETTETLGGIMLESLPPASMSRDALRTIESRLDSGPSNSPNLPAAPVGPLAEIPGLPAFVRAYPTGAWRTVAPGIQRLPIHPPGHLPGTADARVFLLKARPGVKIMPHTHTGVEMTCVLTGSFSHDGERFGPGTFDLGDPATNHTICVGEDGECICLVAMTGDLKLLGFLGRFLQPFVSI